MTITIKQSVPDLVAIPASDLAVGEVGRVLSTTNTAFQDFIGEYVLMTGLGLVALNGQTRTARNYRVARVTLEAVEV